jgi:phosphatidylserine/phosphatidylglycerophosphate/cardiolipin synthase-like enzyme
MIADASQSNSALSPSPGFPLFYGSNNIDGIMHNKFVIIDAESADPNDPWISSGSTNWTTNQVLTDPNNLVLIQDQALARAYQTEFEEMWGSNAATYNAATARFGAAKTDNTPHYFTVGGRKVDLWFSPSDLPNTRITNTLQTAQHTLDFGLLLITKDDLASTMINKHQQGVKVRGIIDDDDVLATPYYTLKNAGVPVYLHTAPQIYHHKCAIIDASVPDSDPTVLTGSHNWTYSAQTINDENTLIIHDPLIADLYRKEFEKRYVEVNPTGIEDIIAEEVQVYPNPTQEGFHVTSTKDMVEIKVLNSLGNVVHFTTKNGVTEYIDCKQWPSGIYFLFIRDYNDKISEVSLVRY